jgi:tungstate transport system ATP-binding protein
MNLQLSVSNIDKSYGGEPVLKNCSYSFQESGIYVLTGPNGSGKSTFLRICALLEEADAGEVAFNSNGQSVEKDIQLKRRITLLLPKIGVFNTTVSKNIAYGLNLRGLKRDQIVDKVRHALDFVGLLQKENQQALTLSSGETQRLGIARALVIEPEIFFLDEPTASVDQKNTDIIEKIIRKMKTDRRLIIMTTHDMAQAKRLADRLLVVKDRKISEI